MSLVESRTLKIIKVKCLLGPIMQYTKFQHPTIGIALNLLFSIAPPRPSPERPERVMVMKAVIGRRAVHMSGTENESERAKYPVNKQSHYRCPVVALLTRRRENNNSVGLQTFCKDVTIVITLKFTSKYCNISVSYTHAVDDIKGMMSKAILKSMKPAVIGKC